jgi:Spy/CpxP family protein refolding chaperone
MSRTRTVFALALVGAFLVAMTAQAQQQGRRGGQRGGGMMMNAGMLLRMEKVQGELKLTDDQKEKIRGLGREVWQDREESDKKLAEILNADQMKRLNEIRVQVGGVGVLVDPAVVKALALTDDQVAKIKELQQKSRENMRSAMQDVTQEERAAKMAELRKEDNAKALEILTPEQREKLEKMKGAKVDIDFSRMQGQRRAGAAK